MKKITLLLSFLFIVSIGFAQTIDIRNFKIDESSNKTFTMGDRFHYSFEIKGDYTYKTHGYRQIDLILYEGSVSSSNEINRIYWNREGDYQLKFDDYTKKEMWVTIYNRNITTIPGTKFILVVKYAGLTTQYVYTMGGENAKYHTIKYRGKTKDEANLSKCNNDSENSVGVNINISQKLTIGKIYNIDRGSGIGYRYYEVTSAQDTPQTSAPTTIGANNVGTSFYVDCSDVELADIEITNLRILRNGSSEIFNSNTNSTPTLSYNNSYEFIYTLKNNGGDAIDVTLSKFFSYNSSFDRYNDYFIADDEISSILPGGEATLRTYVNPDYGYIGNASVSNNQGYYFIFSIVYKNEDNSQSEYENRVGFIYSTNTASKSILTSYKLQGFDFSGNEVLSKEVMSKEEEQVIQSLPKGNYIIKANDETYKIKKD
ncbi:hypothetical protein [Galbibacter sp. BG1]